jgi:SAM-dependent methyltransferase
MIIHPEAHLDRLAPHFVEKRVLEIGCGDGFRSVQIARHCGSLVGIDPNGETVEEAQRLNAADNIVYKVGSATELPLPDKSFGTVVFVLSLHHIPEREMPRAIDEAIRVTPPAGTIVFIEPGFRGTFFELDQNFGVCDGDERRVKGLALAAMLGHPGLSEIEEFWDETHYTLESTDDYLAEFSLDRDRLGEIDEELVKVDHKLWAERRVNVFKRK